MSGAVQSLSENIVCGPMATSTDHKSTGKQNKPFLTPNLPDIKHRACKEAEEEVSEHQKKKR